MNPPVLPGEEASPAEISYDHGQQILMETGGEKNHQRCPTLEGEEQRDKGAGTGAGVAATQRGDPPC